MIIFQLAISPRKIKGRGYWSCPARVHPANSWRSLNSENRGMFPYSAGMTICPEICPPNCTKQAHFKPINCRILAWRSHKSRIFYIMFFNQPFLQRTSAHGPPGNQSGSFSGSNQNWQSAVSFSYHRSKQGLIPWFTIPQFGTNFSLRFLDSANSASFKYRQAPVQPEIP